MFSMITDYISNAISKLLVIFCCMDIEIIKNKISIYFQILVFHFCASGNYSYLAMHILFETLIANIAFWNTKIHLQFAKNVKTF